MSHQPKRTTSPPDDWTRLDDDSRWMAENDAALLAQYRGQWIAVWRREVIGSGLTAGDAASAADRTAPPDEYILCAVEDYPDGTDARFFVD